MALNGLTGTISVPSWCHRPQDLRRQHPSPARHRHRIRRRGDARRHRAPHGLPGCRAPTHPPGRDGGCGGRDHRRARTGSVEVRLRGRDLAFVVTLPAEPSRATSRTLPATGPTAIGRRRRAPPGPRSRRMTAACPASICRMPEHLKARVEQAAGSDGLSVNSWLVRAAATALRAERPRPRGRTPRPARRRALHGLGTVSDVTPATHRAKSLISGSARPPRLEERNACLRYA